MPSCFHCSNRRMPLSFTNWRNAARRGGGQRYVMMSSVGPSCCVLCDTACGPIGNDCATAELPENMTIASTAAHKVDEKVNKNVLRNILLRLNHLRGFLEQCG